MTLYAANENVKDSSWFDQYDLQQLKADEIARILLTKKVFLIDVFDTMVNPMYINGTGEPEEGFALRDGLIEILSFYRENGSRVGIHTDAWREGQLTRNAGLWGLHELVDAYFGKDHWIFQEPGEDGKKDYSGTKDFARMARDMNSDPSEVMIIEDSFYGIRGGLMTGIDTLIVPPYHSNPDFTFADFIPKPET